MTQRQQARHAFGEILCAAAGILSAMSFVVDRQGYVGMSALPAASTSYLWCALAMCFWLLFRQVYLKLQMRLSIGQLCFGLLFGVVNAMGGLLFAYDSWAMLKSMPMLLFTLLRALGQALPMMAAFCGLTYLLEGDALTRPLPCQEPPLSRWERAVSALRRREGIVLFAFFVLCWAPYLLVYYPGTVCWDLGEMAAQFFGLEEMNTWHGVFPTWLLGSCIWLGRLLGSDNLGAFLYTLLQTGTLAYMAAQVLRFLRFCGLNRWARLAVLLFFAVTPLWGGYAQFISKDTLYTAALCLFAIRGAELLLRRESGETAAPAGLICEMALWGLFSCLMRLNGLYVVLPTAVLLVAFAAKGKGRIKVGAALAAALAVAVGFSHVLVPALGILDTSSSGIYSVCFQQSARVLRDHGGSVTPEEYEAIDRVLDAENLPQLYEPWISDPVKYTFRQYGQGAAVEKAAIADYRNTWFAMLRKYPLSYAEAFFAGNISYYCFAPKLEGETYNDQAGNRLVFETYIDQMGEDPRLLHTTQPVPESIRSLVAMFARGWRHIPLLSMLYCCAAYTWLLVGAGLSLAKQRRWRLLCAFVPALMSLAVCMLGPVNDYFRYFLPIAAMAPALVGMCVKK